MLALVTHVKGICAMRRVKSLLISLLWGAVLVACSDSQSAATLARPTATSISALSPATPSHDINRITPHSRKSNRELDEILVQFKDAAAAQRADAIFSKHGVRRFRALRPGGIDASVAIRALAAVPAGALVEDALTRLRADPSISHAERNQIYYALEIPNDTQFPEQWSLHNSNQAPRRGTMLGRAGADIAWPEARDRVSLAGGFLRDVVVAVIDTGIDYLHPELASVVWSNLDEIAGNGRDDDGNGYVDDVRGYNFVSDTPNPMDDVASSHGTHVSGIIGAIAGNAQGIAGVSARVRIMPLKVLGTDGRGRTSDIVEAIDYAVANGAKIVNASLGSDVRSEVLQQAIERGLKAGVLFVVAAGNEHADSSLLPSFPASLVRQGLVAVAATDRRDRMPEFSNWGQNVVHLGAPGEEILSTTRQSTYNFLSGTSMAAPQVTGAAAALLSLGRDIEPGEISLRLIDSVEPIPYLGCRTVSGGRLNLDNLFHAALGSDHSPPAAIADVTPVKVGSDFMVVRFTAPGDGADQGRVRAYEVRTSVADTWPGFSQGLRRCTTTRPQESGKVELVTIAGLEPATSYFIQVKSSDNAGNASFSNVLQATTSPAPRIAWSDDFESGAKTWTTESIGTAWSMAPCPLGRGGNCWFDSAQGKYSNNVRSSLTSPVIDLTSATRALLSFDQYFDFEAGYDFGTIEISRNGGDWQKIYALTDRNAGFSNTAIELTSAVFANVQLRFTVSSDAQETRDGWVIDNLRITYLDEASLPDRILDEPFDGSGRWLMNGGWSITQGVLTESAASNYSNNSLDAATLVSALDFSSVERASLRFDLAYALEDGHDFLIVEASTDGEFWNELIRFTGPAAGAMPTHVESLSLDAYAGHPALWLRYVFASDTTVNAEGAQIDHLRIDAKLANRCGDGRIGDSEQCDLGQANGKSGTCCDVDCKFIAAPQICRASIGLCDAVESCAGDSGICPPDQYVPAGQRCRSSHGDCDVEEQCSGLSPDCPVDGYASTDVVCRELRGACDVVERCDGASSNCPADVVAGNVAICRPSQGPCDIGENCDGMALDCPPDMFTSAGVTCRSAAGICDTAEACNGNSSDCPADRLVQSGTLCREATGPCDVSEQCDGNRTSCPDDIHLPQGTTCRTAECKDGAERQSVQCNNSGQCPVAVTHPCAPFACVAHSCANHCSSKEQCAIGMRCSSGDCIPLSDLGTRCTNSDQCASDHCVDGVCCDTDCDGACLACNATGSVGYCLGISGPARGNRSCQASCINGTCPMVGAGGFGAMSTGSNSTGGTAVAWFASAGGGGTSSAEGGTTDGTNGGGTKSSLAAGGGDSEDNTWSNTTSSGSKGGRKSSLHVEANDVEDATCTCSIAGERSSQGLGWLGLLIVVMLRKRARP